MDTIFDLIKGICKYYLTDKEVIRKMRDEALKTTIGNYHIDTCNTIDCGYETAIWKGNNDMIIVERYANFEQAKKGHQKWCKICENKPKKAYSVQTEEIEKL